MIAVTGPMFWRTNATLSANAERSFFANDVGKPDYKEGPGHDWEVKLVDNQQDSQVVIDSSFVKSYCLNPTKPGDDKIVLPF